MSNAPEQADVTVIGGGISGLSASIHLAQAGLRVICIEPQGISQPVGESLDWSAPALLEALGLPMENLIAAGIATYKRHVTLRLGDGSTQHYIPSDWLGRPPFNIELRTLHVDRLRLDAELRAIATREGVAMVCDKVVAVERSGQTLLAAKTASGARFSSTWFVDASGAGTSLLAREFRLPAHEYGPRKVAMWAYFQVPEPSEGTTIYATGGKPSYMDWIWEIPIRPGIISVGCVAAGDTVKAQRRSGLTVEGIFRAHLHRFPRFSPLLRNAPCLSVHVTSFHCRVHEGVAGQNWIVVGEAASVVDPMTSNGVTAALRHAAEAAALIVRYRRRGRIPSLAASMYSRRILNVGRFFNSGIEHVIYDWPIRNRIGVLTAGDVYTIPAWVMNTVYARLRPRGAGSTLLYCSVLGFLRAAVALYRRLCRHVAPAPEPAG